MKKIDMIVKAPHFFTMAGVGVGYKTGVSMAVDSGKIIALEDAKVIEEEYRAEEVLELDKHAVLPGFIDAHMHTGLAVLRGLAQDTGNWMMYGLQPFSNVATPKAMLAGSKLAIIEAIRAGTTTLGDYSTNMEPVCRFISKIGARGHITQTIRSAKSRVYQPGEVYEFDDELGQKSFRANLKLYDKWHDREGGRIKVLFGPQGPDFVSQELLLEIQREAKARGTKVHMHTQQGDRETYQVVQRYGQRPIHWLAEVGYLDETLITVHLTDAKDDEARMVAQSGASMVLCPGSIAIIDGIVPPSVVFQQAGGNVALGSDQAPGNNCHSIINEMKLAALLNKIKYQDPEVVPAWRALRMATIEGARAVGLGDTVGSLELGKQADFIAIDVSKPTMLPVYTHPMRNIVPNLVYSARGDEVALAAVDGKVIYAGGNIVAIDEEDYIEAVNQYPDAIGAKAQAEFNAIDGTNARFMREEKL